LQAFIYNDGLARFATDEYSKNQNDDNLFMHLTNYAINKESEAFQQNEADFKKSLIETLDIIKEAEGPDVIVTIWAQMIDLIIKTLLTGWPHLDHNYRTCRSRTTH